MRSALRIAAAVIAAAGSHAARAQDGTHAIGERCADCHADVVKSYRSHGMARALGPVVNAELDKLDTVADAKTGYAYRFQLADGAASLIETWHDPNAVKPDAADASPILYAIGAGILDRSYAVRRGELMWFAPLEVLSERAAGARRAVLAPGHAMQPGQRFTIPIAEECLRCHTSTLPPRDYPLNLVPPAEWKPSGIDCVTCHAHAGEHAAWRERELTGANPPGADPLAARSTNPIESVSSCARCHLQGDASLSIAPPERGIPEPGGDLLDRRAIFVAAKPSDDTGFVAHVERLALSRCFRASFDRGAKALTCVTCHDPHRSSFEAVEAERARAACASCHPAGDEPAEGRDRPCALPVAKRGSDQCVRCHMPETYTFDVAEVRIHDHWIRRKTPEKPARIALRPKESRDGQLALFDWPGHTERAHAHDPGLRFMAAMALGRADLGQALVEVEPGPVAAKMPMYHHLRASFFERSGKNDAAVAAYERALALDPAQVESSVNLGGLLARMGRAPAGIQRLTDILQRYPRAEGALRNRAIARIGANDRAGFASDLERAFQIAPLAALARALVQHYEQLGNVEAARRWKREDIRLDPANAAR